MATQASLTPRHAPTLGIVAIFAVIVAGFWPSLYAMPSDLDILHAVHGVLATAWMLLLAAQAWLAGNRRIALHRRLGRLSPWLVGALVLSSLAMVHVMLALPADAMPPVYGVTSPPRYALFGAGPAEIRLVLAWDDLISLTALTGFYGAGLLWQRKRWLHGPLMALTALLAVYPAIGRLLRYVTPWVHTLAQGLDPALWIVSAVRVTLVVVSPPRGRAPWLAGLAVYALMGATMWHAPTWPAYRAAAHMLGHNA